MIIPATSLWEVKGMELGMGENQVGGSPGRQTVARLSMGDLFYCMYLFFDH